eukprot:Phypoly_transcript_11907.p1 GENE.Phypoly_transcript_11907~~Phypoly_transcript_11907.p1  ORF type:complete len:336 (+),score=49.86 Phypoly_transcript_11907:69-1010(+)
MDKEKARDDGSIKPSGKTKEQDTSETSQKNKLGVDEFYNMWSECILFRLVVDVRKKEAFQANHASTAVHFDTSTTSLKKFIEQQMEESPLFEKLVFYDELPFNLSKPLKRIASKLENGEFMKKRVFFLSSGMKSVSNKYDFIWNAKEEDATYPSLIIDDFLYLGEEESALEKEVVKNLGITHILSVLPMTENSAKFKSKVTYCQCALQDIPTVTINKYFDVAIEFIESAKEAKGRILVHCLAGVSRSATLVIVYIMHSLKLTLRESYIYVKQRRGVIQPNAGFLTQLIEHETECLGKASLSLQDFDQIDLLFP